MADGASLRCDVAVIGAGIVGLATALALQGRRPGLRVLVLDKEREPGAHQSGHNSGVIHSGIYYRPGSLKARFCVEGARRLVAFCREHGIRHEICGKVVVATSETELPALEELHRRGTANGVPGLRRLGPAELREVEPHANGVAALHVPGTGIVDYRDVVATMVRLLRERGGELAMGHEVLGAHLDGGRVRLLTSGGEASTGFLVNCAGLYADVVAQRLGVRPDVRIVPFRGEYYVLRPERRRLVKGLIYPVPDPRFPFLGVHFTRRVDGTVEAGPNAVLAWAREGYTRWRLSVREMALTLGYAGFRAMARRYWRTAVYEYYRSLSKRAFTAALQRLVPDAQADDLMPGGAGVRAQAVDEAGRLVDDFRIVRCQRAVHVLNAPSPAATASLVIGAQVADLACGGGGEGHAVV